MTFKKEELIILKAKKTKVETGIDKGLFKTELYQDGKLKAVFPASATQPKRGQKTIIINGWKFALEW